MRVKVCGEKDAVGGARYVRANTAIAARVDNGSTFAGIRGWLSSGHPYILGVCDSNSEYGRRRLLLL